MRLFEVALLVAGCGLWLVAGLTDEENDREDAIYCDRGWTKIEQACYKFFTYNVSQSIKATCNNNLGSTEAIMRNLQQWKTIRERSRKMLDDYFVLCIDGHIDTHHKTVAQIIVSTQSPYGWVPGAQGEKDPPAISPTLNHNYKLKLFTCDPNKATQNFEYVDFILCTIDFSNVHINGSELETQIAEEKSFARRRILLLAQISREQNLGWVIFLNIFLVIFSVFTLVVIAMVFQSYRELQRFGYKIKNKIQDLYNSVGVIQPESEQMRLFLECNFNMDYDIWLLEKQADILKLDEIFGVEAKANDQSLLNAAEDNKENLELQQAVVKKNAEMQMKAKQIKEKNELSKRKTKQK